MSPLKLHCRAEDYLNTFFSDLDGKQKDRLRECILKYTPPEASASRSQKINYVTFRVFNFFKSLIHKSEWQTTVKETIRGYFSNPENLPLKSNDSKEMIDKVIPGLVDKIISGLMNFHINSAESSPQVSEKLMNISKKISGHSEVKENITLTEEDLGLNSLIKCTHAKHSYWNLPKK